MKQYFLVFLFPFFLVSSSAQIDLKITLNDSTNNYEVYLRSTIDLSTPLNFTNSGLVTLTVPSGGFEVDDLISVNGTWDLINSFVNPIVTLNRDYLAFNLVQPHEFEYKENKEILLFTFKNKGVCIGSIELMEEDDPLIPPNYLNLYLGNLFTVLGVGPVNAFSEIYGKGSANCLEAQNYTDLKIYAKAFLQGAYTHQDTLMYDKLRQNNLIPLTTPYPYFEVKKFTIHPLDNIDKTLPSVLISKEEKSVVDWVFLELRDSTNSIIATNSALIRRDGFIVDVDGESPINFYAQPGSYSLVVKHRNHLGVMTAESLNLEAGKIDTIDFTSLSTPTYGNYAQREIDGKNYLWAGDTNMDGQTIYIGKNNDLSTIAFELLKDEQNPDRRFNHIIKGYKSTDSSMDGNIKYQGGNNDIDDYIFFNVFSHPNNHNLFYLNLIIQEQIP